MSSSSSKRDDGIQEISEKDRLAIEILQKVRYFTEPARRKSEIPKIEQIESAFIVNPRLRILYEDLVDATSKYWDDDKSRDIIDNLDDEDIWHIRTLREDIETLRSEGRIPTPLRPLAEKLLLFYGERLFPYTVPLREKLEGLGLVESVIFSLCFGLSWTIGMFSIHERWSKGMMRDKYVKIIEAVMNSYMDELRDLVDSKVSYEKIEMVGNNMRNMLQLFFISERSRSAHMEDTLLKYLKEDGVNMEVARGVWDATRRFRGECKAFQLEAEDRSTSAEEEEHAYFQKIARHVPIMGSGIDLCTYSLYWDHVIRRNWATQGETDQ